jgi:hypothetical protein
MWGFICGLDKTRMSRFRRRGDKTTCENSIVDTRNHHVRINEAIYIT